MINEDMNVVSKTGNQFGHRSFQYSFEKIQCEISRKDEREATWFSGGFSCFSQHSLYKIMSFVFKSQFGFW